MNISDYMILATSERYRDVATFWRGQIGDLGEIMGALRSASGATSATRHSLIVPLGPPALRAIEKLADDPLGRFAVLSAAIALSTARYFNRTRVLLRTPLIRDEGPAVLNGEKELPLVFAVDSHRTLLQFVQYAATIVEQSYTLQDYPVHMLCEQERGTDLFAVAEFSLSSNAIHAAPLQRLAPIHFDLDGLGKARLEIDFDPLVAEPFLVSGLASLISATLGHFANLSTPIRAIERVPEEQRQRLLVEWNRTGTDHGPFRSVIEHFEEQVRRTPDARALSYGSETLSYDELNARINRLARHLIDTSTPGSTPIVAIWMDRSPWMVIAVLGALKAGLAYVPIDADCPRERVAFLLRDSGAARLLTDRGKADAAAGLDCDTVFADDEFTGPPTDPEIRVAPSDLAYVIYTSGSTGAPKGCEIEHHSLLNYLLWANDYYWTSAERGTMALFTPLSFDLTVPSLFCPLMRGRTLVVFPQAMAIDVMLQRQFHPASTIDSVKLTPSHFRVLDANRPRATNVRLVIVGGEALTSEHVAIIHGIDPRIRIVNEYGPTEATVGCVVKDIVAGEPIVIGRPIANARAYVLDEDQRLVPIGIRGEICIGGAGVARGYHARPELDVARFLPDPFVPRERIYRTRDIGRWLPNGELECFGRVDNQLKVRGYRIEPGEIEAALRRCEGVEEAVVVERDAELVAYVVSRAAVDGSVLRASLAQALPLYMVPTAFVGLTELPLTTNGTLDRARLPASAPLSAGPRPYVAPRNMHEQVVATIWAQTLRVDRVGVDDNFFELGGHSLRAMAMMQPICEALGVEVSIGEVLAHPSVAALAKLLQTKTPTEVPPIPSLPPAEHYALSPGQRRLWAIDRIEEHSPAYNVSSAFELYGALDLEAMAKAFDAVVARHESLRTVFVEVDDEPRQRILPELRLPIAYVDLRQERDQEQRLQTLVEQQASAPFDLGRGPLLRVNVLQLADTQFVVALTIHHIVSDEWSMRVLIGEVVRLYDGYRTRVASLPSLPIQYKDFAAWQGQLLADDSVNTDKQYWRAKLGDGVAVLDLPADFARPPVPTYRGRHHQVRIDASTRAKLRSLGAAHGASPFMTLLAIVKVLLYRYTGETDIAVGSPIAGRVHADLANQIGFFVNTLVLRARLNGAEPFTSLLTQVRQIAEEAYAHQMFPFDRLVDALDVPRDLSRSPLFGVMVVYESDTDVVLPETGLAVEEVRVESGVSKFDLTFAFAESERGIELEVEYSTELFRAQTVERMTADLLRLIDGVTADASVPIDRLAIEGPIVGARVRRARNATPVLPTQDVTVPVAPRNERELLLVGVLESLLGTSSIGVTHNFFYVGGDSIKAIQLVNRLARQGWALRVRDVFEAPTIEQLAMRLNQAAAPRRLTPVTGAVPLTPIQRWFFLTQQEGRAHYNQSVMLRFNNRLEDESVRHLGRALVEHHDALRLQFEFDGDSVNQSYGEPYDPVDVRDLRGAADPIRELQHSAAAAQASLDLERGVLARFVLFHLPDDDRLLAIIHHLAVDGVSWRVLFEDLRVGLAQAAGREPMVLSPKTDSFQTWALALESRAAEIESEREWWEHVERVPTIVLPVDTDAAESLERDASVQQLTLSAEDTEALRSRVHRAYNTRPNDVLLTALARALRDWAGVSVVRLDVEGHGRDAVEEIDVSRTVGWFTTLYPIVLDVGDDPDPGRQLTRVKMSLRAIPGNGSGYGLLRGGRPTGSSILFNFLGHFDTDVEGFDVAQEARGNEYGPLAKMTHDVSIGGWIGEGQLHITARYSRRRFHDHTIARLLGAYKRALEAVIAHCRQRTTSERTVADFRYADRTTPSLLEQLGADRVEDLYPLSPMQQGMLYHSAVADDVPVYIEQFTCTITGALDVDAFRAAWERVIARHAALRTAFFWNESEQPVQVVFSHVDTPWVSHDWRSLAGSEWQARLEQFARKDRDKGIDLTTAPLLRFTLIRLSDQRFEFFWTSHHIVLDGWSTAIVLQEVFGLYQATVGGSEFKPAPARPFGDYIDWLDKQNAAEATSYWRNRLQGFSKPTPLPLATRTADSAGAYSVCELTLGATDSDRLATAVREQHLTMNTLARGVWAVVLAAHARERDVVYGATIAGRPASLADVENMVGLFINTLPIRVRIEPNLPFARWLQRLQFDHADLDQYAYSSLADIQQTSDVPRRTPLFESILVFENYPIDQSLDPDLSNLAIEGIEIVEQTNYPLTLVVVPGQQLLLRLSYDTSRYDDTTAQAVLREVEALLGAFMRDPHQTLASALGSSPTDDSVVRCRFELAADTAALVQTIAARLATPVVETVKALGAILFFRYAAHEDLRCAFDSHLFSRDDLRGDDTVADVVQKLAIARAGREDESTCDLSLSVSDADGRPTFDARSGTGRFTSAFLQRIHDHLTALIASVAANPQEPIARLRVLPEAERVRLLEEFNRTDKDWGPERSIVQYFEEQVAAHPERPAILLPSFGRDDVDRDQVWTYGALNARANQLARALVQWHGVGPDVIVGVLAERSFEMVLALMAIEKAGGAYVPLDPDYPSELLDFMMRDSGAAVILTQKKFKGLTSSHDGAVIGLDTDWDVFAEADGNLPSRVTGDSLAYVIYTSGSTGRPKGAMNTHRGIANRLLWMQDAYQLTEHDRVLQKTPFSFDVSVWEFFWPLMVGAELVIAKPGGHRDATYLVGLIADTAVTTLHFVPSMLQAFIEEPGLEQCRALKRVIGSGEAITPELLRRYQSRLQVPLHNLYGPTEAAVDVTAWTCETLDARSMVPIGTPIANIRLYILNAQGELMPHGTTGELLLGGVGVGRGYLNRPELTAEKFVPDPFQESPNGRLYRTGDLARYREDGLVDFLGRIDHQIKLRGFRIELGEIESAILTHPAVRECVVVVQDEATRGKRLVAYVVEKPLADSTPTGIREHLRQRLPNHMVPEIIVPLANLPRLPNGKLDRKSLPAPETVHSKVARHVTPRNAVEQRLVSIWESVLGHRMVGVTDDFFELGGHSLLALKLVSAVQREFGRPVPLAHLFAHPSVERFAVALQRAYDPRDWRPLVAIKRGTSAPPLFLLPGAGGNVIYFHSLAQHLTTSRPIYALQAIGLDGRTTPLETLEAIAAANINELREVWPTGPYLLAGHSFGARVALEMAQQLQRQGASIAFLGILDTAAPTFEPIVAGADWQDAHWLAKIAREIEEFAAVRLDLTLDDLMPLSLDAQLTLVVERMQHAGMWAPGAERDQLRGYLQVYKANSQAPFVRYEHWNRAPIALFKARESGPAIEATPAGLVELTTQHDWGWSAFARGPVSVVEVPGSHLSMLGQPHVIELARALDDALLRADTRSQRAADETPA